MLSIHVLNVGHGDSIVLEHDAGGRKSFALIDSFGKSGAPPKALQKLQALGAETISFVALTHPHKDHYVGLADVLAHYQGSVDKVLTFPIERDRGRLEKLIDSYARVVKNMAAEQGVRFAALQFIKFLKLASKVTWEAPVGLIGLLDVSHFDGVQFSHVLPPAKVKGEWFDGIDKGVYPLESPKPNELSLAIQLSYGGVTILLGADGVRPLWLSQAKSAERARASFRSQIVKIPHHGSGVDAADDVLNVLFRTEGDSNIALISADGRSHPDPSVLESMKARKIRPYCTNLAKVCGGGSVHAVLPAGELDPALGRFLNSVATGRRPPGFE